MPAPPSETDEDLEYETRIAASPHTVFEFFTDPAKMVQWMGTEATLDPSPGGVCRVNPSGHLVMSGQFVEVDPPRRLVFSWGWETSLFETPPQSTVVEVSLEPDGGRRVLVEPDPEGKSISGCPNLGLTIKPCTSTLKVQVGYSTDLKVDGRAICLDTVTGLTDGTPPGTVKYHVRSPGQKLFEEK